MNELVVALNDSAEQPVWEGRADVHYICLWNTTKLILKDYEVVSCGIHEHAWRRAQYFQFAVVPDGEPLHVYHNHSPQSNKNLTNGRKKRIVKTLWDHVLTKASAAQPAVLFAGDFNCTPLEWTMCFNYVEHTQASRRTVQTCTSKLIPLLHGDRAIAINVRALQEDSGFGKSWDKNAFSDAHDVVLVPLYWGSPANIEPEPEQQPEPKPSAPAGKRSSSSVQHSLHREPLCTARTAEPTSTQAPQGQRKRNTAALATASKLSIIVRRITQTAIRSVLRSLLRRPLQMCQVMSKSQRPTRAAVLHSLLHQPASPSPPKRRAWPYHPLRHLCTKLSLKSWHAQMMKTSWKIWPTLPCLANSRPKHHSAVLNSLLTSHCHTCWACA